MLVCIKIFEYLHILWGYIDEHLHIYPCILCACAYICVLYYDAHKPLHICRDVCLYVVYLLMLSVVHLCLCIYIYVNIYKWYYVFGTYMYMCYGANLHVVMYVCSTPVPMCLCGCVLTCLYMYDSCVHVIVHILVHLQDCIVWCVYMSVCLLDVCGVHCVTISAYM